MIPKLLGLPSRIGALSFVNYNQTFSLGSTRWYTKPSGPPGPGASKVGVGGNIEDTGAGIGRYGSAQEDAYFHAKQREELAKLKKKLKDNPELMQKKDK